MTHWQSHLFAQSVVDRNVCSTKLDSCNTNLNRFLPSNCIRFRRKQINRSGVAFLPSQSIVSSSGLRTWYCVRESDIWEVAVDAETDIEPKTPEAAAEAEDVEGIPMEEDGPMDAFTGWRLVFRFPTSWKDMLADFFCFLVCIECLFGRWGEAKKSLFPSVVLRSCISVKFAGMLIDQRPLLQSGRCNLFSVLWYAVVLGLCLVEWHYRGNDDVELVV